MHRSGVFALLLVVTAGCGTGEEGGGGFVAASTRDLPLTIETPTTIVGLLEVTVEEGPVGDDDISEINFGNVEVEGGYVLVEIPGDVLRAAGLAWDDLQTPSRYELSVSGPGEVIADAQIPSYAVESLTPLD